MQGWEIACVPFSCKQIEPDDLLFLDPPYDSIDPKSKGFTSYYGGVFGFSEQVALVEKVCNHPGPILAANRATPRIMQLYRDYGFSVREVLAPRRIAASGDRTPATEMFATKNL
jgi:DNA adenine methylase